MHRLMFKTWRKQCAGPCALILLVWCLTTITFPDPRPHNTGKIVPKPRSETPSPKSTTTDARTNIEHTVPSGGTHQYDSNAEKLSPVSEANNIIINPHNFLYTINNPETCNDSHVFVLIFVHSAPDHFLERKLIRSTWASVRSYQNRTIRTVFLLAQPATSAVQTKIEQENTQHSDVIQEDFLDHYRNLTYKHIMGLKWVTNFCSHAQAIVKVDDDTYVHIFRLVKFMTQDYYFSRPHHTFSPSGNIRNDVRASLRHKKSAVISARHNNNDDHDVIYCSVFHNQSARRDKSDKWYVSRDEYPADKYPTWCEGFAYIATPHLVEKLYRLSLQTKYYWIDDVYVTGILAEKLNVTHRQFRNPFGYSRLAQSKPPYDDVLFLLEKQVRNEERWMTIWNVTSAIYL